MARHPSQTLLAFTLDRELANLMDSASASRGENRSQFIRRALVNYLRELGHPIAESVTYAPDRRLLELRVADAADEVPPEAPPAPPKAVTYKIPRKKKKP